MCVRVCNFVCQSMLRVAIPNILFVYKKKLAIIITMRGKN